jgi:hypothetical protein
MSNDTLSEMFGSAYNAIVGGLSSYLEEGRGQPNVMTDDDVSDMYKVTLESSKGLKITANLPQNFSLNLGSNWDDPYNKPFVDEESSGLAGSGGETAMGGAGTTSMQSLGGLSWQSGAHLEFNIPFVFRATHDASIEIVTKMKNLLQLVAPSMDGDRLVKPGADDTELTLKIGHFLEISPVIVDSINEEFDTMFDKDGNPIAVTINISIKTKFTVTDKDLDDWFVSL